LGPVERQTKFRERKIFLGRLVTVGLCVGKRRAEKKIERNGGKKFLAWQEEKGGELGCTVTFYAYPVSAFRVNLRVRTTISALLPRAPLLKKGVIRRESA
jgi:hypothetical protein